MTEKTEEAVTKINVAGEALSILIGYSNSIEGPEIKKAAGDAIDLALKKMKEGLENL